MVAPLLPPKPIVRSMTWSYRVVFLFAIALGLVAIGAGTIELAGLDFGFEFTERMTSGEASIALAVGVLLQVFAWSALTRARIRLDKRTLQYLSLGPFCTTASVDLDNIRRFGTGLEKHGYQSFHVLVLELHDGSKRSIKISMYERWRDLTGALGLALGQNAVAGQRGLLGIRLEDADE